MAEQIPGTVVANLSTLFPLIILSIIVLVFNSILIAQTNTKTEFEIIRKERNFNSCFLAELKKY